MTVTARTTTAAKGDEQRPAAVPGSRWRLRSEERCPAPIPRVRWSSALCQLARVDGDTMANSRSGHGKVVGTRGPPFVRERCGAEAKSTLAVEEVHDVVVFHRAGHGIETDRDAVGAPEGVQFGGSRSACASWRGDRARSLRGLLAGPRRRGNRVCIDSEKDSRARPTRQVCVGLFDLVGYDRADVVAAAVEEGEHDDSGLLVSERDLRPRSSMSEKSRASPVVIRSVP